MSASFWPEPWPDSAPDSVCGLTGAASVPAPSLEAWADGTGAAGAACPERFQPHFPAGAAVRFCRHGQETPAPVVMRPRRFLSPAGFGASALVLRGPDFSTIVQASCASRRPGLTGPAAGLNDKHGGASWSVALAICFGSAPLASLIAGASAPLWTAVRPAWPDSL